MVFNNEIFSIYNSLYNVCKIFMYICYISLNYEQIHCYTLGWGEFEDHA